MPVLFLGGKELWQLASRQSSSLHNIPMGCMLSKEGGYRGLKVASGNMFPDVIRMETFAQK
jgi:hypothetical protein